MAEWLGFNGPVRGPGSVEDVVSHLPAIKSELKAQASAVAARARSNLSLHRDTGSAKISVVSPPTTKLDWYIALHDPDNGEALGETEDDRAFGPQNEGVDRSPNKNRSALSIELGHWVKTKKGRVWVDGIHALGNAVDDRVRKHGGK